MWWLSSLLSSVRSPSSLMTSLSLSHSHSPCCLPLRQCEESALKISKLDFTDDEEKEQIEDVFRQALMCLSEEDRGLQAIDHMLPLLKKGIGIHHGGLLPILKELIEILFQEQLVKILFATETFAMGLNMPAKTVIFTAMRKWDGESHR